MRKRLLLLLLFVAATGLLSGCSLKKEGTEKTADLDFTIVAEQDIPKEFQSILEEKKQNPMTLTFLDQDGLYLAVGYGTQKTTGYSIGVEALYLTENGICLDTTLIGPAKGEKVTETESWPYIVIKTERREEDVTFQ